jgi:hypothetical protein
MIRQRYGKIFRDLTLFSSLGVRHNFNVLILFEDPKGLGMVLMRKVEEQVADLADFQIGCFGQVGRISGHKPVVRLLDFLGRFRRWIATLALLRRRRAFGMLAEPVADVADLDKSGAF